MYQPLFQLFFTKCRMRWVLQLHYQISQYFTNFPSFNHFHPMQMVIPIAAAWVKVFNFYPQ